MSEAQLESSPQDQLERVWEALVAHNCPHSSSNERDWPSYDKVMDDVARADYTETLTCPHDLRFFSQPSKEKTAAGVKSLCPYGVVCRAKLELFPFPEHNHPFYPYTGLLGPDSMVEHCLIRLSSAIKPPRQEIKSKLARALLLAAGEKIRHAKLFPTAAIKVFRGKGARSGNLLFGGCKVGQREEDYFAHCQATQMTERMPRMLKPFVRKFWQYSDTPLSLGLSDFCTYDQDGNEVGEEIQFPFALVLRPRYESSHDEGDSTKSDHGRDTFDRFLDEVLAIPEGSVLFDVFACPTPGSASSSAELQRIGRVITTSNMIPSAPDDNLFFRHQRKEDDYELKPEWKEQLKTKCTVTTGRTTSTGTVGTLAGWELFESHIAHGDYCDFERA